MSAIDEQNNEQAAVSSEGERAQRPATSEPDKGGKTIAELTEEERTRTRRRTNRRIAHWCSFFALVIILIDFAAYVIGQADEFFTTAGIMIAIALLAFASLNNPTDPSKRA